MWHSEAINLSRVYHEQNPEYGLYAMKCVTNAMHLRIAFNKRRHIVERTTGYLNMAWYKALKEHKVGL